MSPRDEALLEDTLRAIRERHVAPVWEALDRPDPERFRALWTALAEAGLTGIALPEAQGGVPLEPAGRLAVLRGLGAAAPGLGFALISHLGAVALLVESAGDALPAPLGEALATGRFALAGSPLDRRPATGFTVGQRLSGSQRVGLPWPDWLVVAARQGEELRLCVVGAADPGVRFAARPSSHGLRMVPFGDLTVDDSTPAWSGAWPGGGRAAAQADGLLTALLAGMVDELAERAARFAVERYQGGKMIHEHDAVRQLVGPIELARRPLGALALATLAGEAPGDGGASAFAVELARQAALDAIQTLGGSGYMEDFHVERYLRDAGTLETTWIHAAARRRDIARARFDALGA